MAIDHEQMERNRRMLELVRAIGRVSNLIGTDLRDAKASRVSVPAIGGGDQHGVQIQFVITAEAMGRCLIPREVYEALGLLDDPDE